MAKSVWKFPLKVEDQFHVQMPVDAEILSVQVQRGAVCAWALCPVSPDAPKAPRYFVCVGTGHEYVDHYFQSLRFLGTVQLNEGDLVFHYFEEPEVMTADNTPQRLIAPPDFDRLVAAIERIANALDRLAPLKAAQKADLSSLMRSTATRSETSIPTTTQETVTTVTVKLQEVGGDGKTLEGSAPVPHGSDWREEADRLESDLVAHETAKRVLGDELCRAFENVKPEDSVPGPVAVQIRGRAMQVLGGDDAFAKAREAVGVTRGRLPTFGQARDLIYKHIVPAALANKAKAATAVTQEKDEWE